MSADDELGEEHEEHVNHEAWVIPYADLLTLLMAMFIALFAMSTVDMEKFKELSIGFSEALGGGEMDTGVFAGSKGDGIVGDVGNGARLDPGGSPGAFEQPADARAIENLLRAQANLDVAKSEQRQSLEEVKQQIESEAEAKGLVGNLGFRLDERGLVVTVVTDQVLFDSGSATLRGEGGVVLTLVGEALRDLDNAILIEGHTDNRPISTSAFPSNWELSSGRAGAVARYFEGMGLDRQRLRAVGMADNHPLAGNDTDEGRARNRRVEIVVQSTVVEQVLEDAGVGDQPAEVMDPVEDPVDGIDSIVPDLRHG